MDLNRNTIKKIIFIGIVLILAYSAIGHIDLLVTIIKWIVGIISPFILGLAMAFILNVPMRAIERALFDNYKGKRKILIKKIKRPVSFVLTLLCFIGVIAIVVLFVTPELIKTIQSVIDVIPGFFANLQTQAEQLINEYQWLAESIGSDDISWTSIGSHLTSFISAGAAGLVNSTMSIASSIINGIVTFFIGFVFAIYVLFQKEKLGVQLKKLSYAYLPEHRVDRAIEILKLSDRIFSKFLSGQCLEAVILGTLFFIVLSIFGMPYALLIGVLIGFTALVPIIGAFIGCGVGALLILMVSPVKMLIFIIIFLVLQQLEGNLIYPKVVGNSIGLPSIWVLAAVTIGGNLMGVVGMLIFIPLVSVLYTLLREATNKRLKSRKIQSKKYNKR